MKRSCSRSAPATRPRSRTRFCSCTAPRWPGSRLRSSGRGPAGFLGDRLVRAPRLSTAGASMWRATAARKGVATMMRRSRKAPTTASPRHTISRSSRQPTASGLRYLLGRAAHRVVRAASSRQGRPACARRHGLDGEGSPTLAERKKKLPEFIARNHRPIDKAFIHSIFDRDHPGTAEIRSSTPSPMPSLRSTIRCRRHLCGYVSRLPVIDPKGSPCLRWSCAASGTASRASTIWSDSSPGCQTGQALSRHPGISHASFQQKNYALVYHILWSFFAQPAPIFAAERS